MADLILPIRYCRIFPEPHIPPREENFRYAKLTWSLPVEETALVLIDCWDISRIESHLERNERIVGERLAPVAKACRKAGITIIHAPSPETATKYPQWVRYAGDETLFEGDYLAPDWPPEDFRGRRGDYQNYAIPREPRKAMLQRQKERSIMSALTPQPQDLVIGTGEQLHRLCRHRRILHLLYAGFAANVCVLYRDYGTRAFGKRGYNIILLRDCTSAIEAQDTLEGELLKKAAILGIEMLVGSTTTSQALLDACEALS